MGSELSVWVVASKAPVIISGNSEVSEGPRSLGIWEVSQCG